MGALGKYRGVLEDQGLVLCVSSWHVVCPKTPPGVRPPAATPVPGRGWIHCSPWALAVLLRAQLGRGLGSRAGALPLLWGPGLVSVGRPPPPYRCTKARSVMLCGSFSDPKSEPAGVGFMVSRSPCQDLARVLQPNLRLCNRFICTIFSVGGFRRHSADPWCGFSILVTSPCVPLSYAVSGRTCAYFTATCLQSCTQRSPDLGSVP